MLSTTDMEELRERLKRLRLQVERERGQKVVRSEAVAATSDGGIDGELRGKAKSENSSDVLKCTVQPNNFRVCSPLIQ